MLESDNYDKDELIRKSQELDKYIVEVMKQEILKPIAVKDENKKRIRNDYWEFLKAQINLTFTLDKI